MATTFKARFSQGVLKPLETLDLTEGEEVTITIAPMPCPSGDDWIAKTAGAWVGFVDAEKLKRDILENRTLASRPEPRL